MKGRFQTIVNVLCKFYIIHLLNVDAGILVRNILPPQLEAAILGKIFDKANEEKGIRGNERSPNFNFGLGKREIKLLSAIIIAASLASLTKARTRCLGE